MTPIKHFFLSATQALLLPIKVLTNPWEAYGKLRYTVKQAPPAATAIANIYAYRGFSIISAMLILMAGFIYSMYNMATLRITQAFGGFIHSIIVTFLYPMLIAIALGLIDTILIIIPAKKSSIKTCQTTLAYS